MDAVRLSGPADADILAVLSVADLKAEQRVMHALEDAVLRSCILDAYAYFDGREGWLRRALLPQQWVLYRDAFAATKPGHLRAPFADSPCHPRRGAIELPLPPLISVDEVAYQDAGVWSVVDPAAYVVEAGSLFGRIVPLVDTTWPTMTRQPRGVRLTFTAGYAPVTPQPTQDNPTPAAVPTVPRGVVRAMKLLAGSLYANREATLEETRITTVSKRLEYGIDALAGRLRIPNDLNERFA